MRTKKLSIFLFFAYLLLLVWMIVYKMNLNVLYGRYDIGSINLLPFAGTAVYDGVLYFPEILFNIISFIPFGIYMEMLFRKASWGTNLFVIMLVSLSFEVAQYVLLLGIADITDILANVLGGAIGINIMYVLTSIWREKSYTRMNVFCLFLTFLVIAVTYLIV
ncbi:VanZ family protein [Streptococcus ruminantium]|uniref:VanZ family protein n=2 Tax=Streptococcus ruminantium TaxID=1917441 RepID=A0ABU1B0V1_9STRE|nr:VanZ family protein [Streptococcus ruminantium]MDQ8759201.1 VanZ family protein [Streptococcus ruminantium]MDQ8764252.1 VanZ family protein [Streptococcus ruminantium]MDQ8766456.1 VanZ family protein [Streptococcus ruminantium]MDQ8769026.1 VanZ family protein [Streptococcus ruminantium]MDQ8774418.1 VanZ family protein [Streptococcus ruminantium]